MYVMLPSAACEPVSSYRNMAPVSSPVKQSYADRPDSPESVPAEGKYLLLVDDVKQSINEWLFNLSPNVHKTELGYEPCTSLVSCYI